METPNTSVGWQMEEKRKNTISSLSIQGQVVHDFGKIKDEAIRYYASLYRKKGGDKPRLPNLFSSRIEEEVTLNLEKPFMVEEVKHTILCMEKDKSLSSDGFLMLFFQECWDIVEEDLMKVFTEFYERGVISKGVNATFLVLLPKKSEAEEISDFRPISLVGSFYKIIDKVLSI